MSVGVLFLWVWGLSCGCVGLSCGCGCSFFVGVWGFVLWLSSSCGFRCFFVSGGGSCGCVGLSCECVTEGLSCGFVLWVCLVSEGLSCGFVFWVGGCQGSCGCGGLPCGCRSRFLWMWEFFFVGGGSACGFRGSFFVPDAYSSVLHTQICAHVKDPVFIKTLFMTAG